jgi:triosephosphate isomerase
MINKVYETVDADLLPILCVDKPDELRQFRALQDCDCTKMIVAYSPVDALNFRIPASPAEVAAAADTIMRTGPAESVVYGGAVDRDNAGRYLELGGICGLFVGTASLEAKVFIDICRLFDAR